jgi:hypothetical protein
MSDVSFARNLELHRLPEWSSEYISYKELKKIIRICDAQNPRPQNIKLNLAVTERAITATVQGSGDISKHVR